MKSKQRKPGLGAYRWPVGFGETAGEVLEAAAKAANKPVAEIIRVIVEDHLRKEGLLKPPVDPLSALRAARKDESKR